MLKERRNKAKAFVLTVAILCIFSPTFLNATVTQDNVDFGEIEVGSSETVRLGIQNPNQTAITVSFSFSEGEGAFSVIPSRMLLEPGQINYLTITFSPTDGRYYSDTLNINDSLPETAQEVFVQGRGIVEEKPSIDRLLNFVDESLQNESLKGYGPGKSADKRLKTFINMLEKAEASIRNNDFDGACGHLRTALKKVNFFITGESVIEIEPMIRSIMGDLGCQIK